MTEKYIAEKDQVIVGTVDEDEEFDELGDYNYVVVNTQLSEVGYEEKDIICRCQEQREAARIAELLTEHGLDKS